MAPEPSAVSPASVDAPLGEHLRVSVCASQGGRRYMEDRVHIHCERDADGRVVFTFVAVYDGHGGGEASDFARKHLLRTIVEQPGFASTDDDAVLQAIRDGFVQTHQDMRRVVDEWPRTASGFTSTAGTTASVAFIRRGKVYTGHVGDSAIVLGTRTKDGALSSTRMTVDHKPDVPSEMRRIEEAGGEVMSKAGVVRVVWTRPVRGHTGPVRRSTPREKIPFLAVARSLGDLWSYNQDADDYIVSPEPDVEVLTLTPADCCLVLGSDGIWNVMKPQFSVDVINAQEWKEQNGRILDRSVQTNHARWLTRHGLRSWGSLRADNITVITVLFDSGDSVPTPNVLCSERDMDIEAALTTQPDAVLRISPDNCQLLKAAPVDLVFVGAIDTPVDNGYSSTTTVTTLRFSGPGFSSYSTETVRRRWPLAGENADPASEPEDCEKARLSAASPNGTRRTFFCSRHGLACEKAAKATERVASTAVAARKAGVKPKYFCRKHGLTCEKVKKMNAEHASAIAAAAVVEKPLAVDSDDTEQRKDEEAPMTPEAATEPTEGARPMQPMAVGSAKKRRDAVKVVYNTRRMSRTTRSGSRLSPTKSAPSLRARSRLPRSRGRPLAYALTPPGVGLRRNGVLSVRLLKRLVAKPTDARRRRRLLTVDVLSSSDASPAVAGCISSRTRSRASVDGATPGPNGAWPLTSPTGDRLGRMFGTLNLETGMTACSRVEPQVSALLRCSISPRFLERAPSSPIGKPRVGEGKPATVHQNGTTPGSHKRRRLFDEDDEAASANDKRADEPARKRSRLWSLLNFFGGSSTSTD